MKKLFSTFLLQFLVLGLAFCAAINSKEGYIGIPWRSSVKDAEKAGYKLTLMNSPADKEYMAKLYMAPAYTDSYNVTTKDKKVKALQFHYYYGNLFLVTETLTESDLNPKKLESRYGDFAKQGIYLAGKQYTDAKVEKNGTVSSLSISISNSNGNVTATMYDWERYKDISYVGQKLSQEQNKVKVQTPSQISNTVTIRKGSIIEELEDMANKLVQAKAGTSKPSFAFLALSTDYKNTLVENYVTDALTEAMFNTGKIKIIERANLETILDEQKFQSSGLVNEENVKSIGMIAGADFVCYGTLKDLEDSFTVNARVVDVETGELCAISRATITKDNYLKKQPQSAVGSTKAFVTSTTTKDDSNAITENKITAPNEQKTESTSPKKAVVDNAWKVTKNVDIFEDCTYYTFIINSSEKQFLFINYKKGKNSGNNRIIAGIHWFINGWADPRWRPDQKGTYEVKGENATVVLKNFNNTDSHTNISDDAWKAGTFCYAYDSKVSARWIVEIMKNSDSVAVRRDGMTRRFQTAGLLDKMAEYGITWAEIDAALANEEF